MAACRFDLIINILIKLFQLKYSLIYVWKVENMIYYEKSKNTFKLFQFVKMTLSDFSNKWFIWMVYEI